MARVSDRTLDRELQKIKQETGLLLEFGSASGYTWIEIEVDGGGTKRFSEDYRSNSDLLSWMHAYMQGWRMRGEAQYG